MQNVLSLCACKINIHKKHLYNRFLKQDAQDAQRTHLRCQKCSLDRHLTRIIHKYIVTEAIGLVHTIYRDIP